MSATSEDRLFGLTTSVAVKPAVAISADYHITTYGEQTIESSTMTGDRTITTQAGMRILLINQDNPIDNGIWLAGPAAWTRAPDFGCARDVVNGTLVFNIYGDCWQVEAEDPIQIGYNAIAFRSTYPFSGDLNALRISGTSIPGMPNLSLMEGKLVANASGRPVSVLPEFGSAADVMIAFANPIGAQLSVTSSGDTVQDEIDTLNKIVTLRSCGGIVDGVSDDKLAFIAAIERLKAIGGGQLIIGGVTYLSAGSYDLSGCDNIDITGGEILGPETPANGTPSLIFNVFGEESDVISTFSKTYPNPSVSEFTEPNAFNSGDIIVISNYPTDVSDAYTQETPTSPRVYSNVSESNLRQYRRMEILQVRKADSASFNTVQKTVYGYGYIQELKAVKINPVKNFKISCSLTNVSVYFKHCEAPSISGNAQCVNAAFDTCIYWKSDIISRSINSDCRIDTFNGSRAGIVSGIYTGMNGPADNSLIKILGSNDVSISNPACVGSDSDTSYTHGIMIDTEFPENPNGYPSLPSVNCSGSFISSGLKGDSLFLTCDPFASKVVGCNIMMSDKDGSLHVKGADNCRVSGIGKSVAFEAGSNVDISGMHRDYGSSGNYMQPMTNPRNTSQVVSSDKIIGLDMGFEPTITGTTTTGSIHYVNRTGVYKILNNRVNFRLALAWSDASGFDGAIRISLPPFSTSSGVRGGFNIGEWIGFDVTNGITAYAEPGTQSIVISSNGSTQLGTPEAGRIDITGEYEIFTS